jgi:energy-converting hydrogenase Eha subunit C
VSLGVDAVLAAAIVVGGGVCVLSRAAGLAIAGLIVCAAGVAAAWAGFGLIHLALAELALNALVTGALLWRSRQAWREDGVPPARLRIAAGVAVVASYVLAAQLVPGMSAIDAAAVLLVMLGVVGIALHHPWIGRIASFSILGAGAVLLLAPAVHAAGRHQEMALIPMLVNLGITILALRLRQSRTDAAAVLAS